MTAFAVIAIVFSLIAIVVTIGGFVWAAREDGRYQKQVQTRMRRSSQLHERERSPGEWDRFPGGRTFAHRRRRDARHP
jgi:hypothetical protein